MNKDLLINCLNQLRLAEMDIENVIDTNLFDPDFLTTAESGICKTARILIKTVYPDYNDELIEKEYLMRELSEFLDGEKYEDVESFLEWLEKELEEMKKN